MTTQSPVALDQSRPHYTHRQILEIMAGLMMAMLTAMISTSVVSTALPTIVGDLGGQDQLSWVASASLLTMTASTPLWGKLSDIFGRKLMFQGALTLFVLASVGAGLSQSIGQLIAARAFQGLGVGGLSALAQVILGDVVDPRQRGRYAGFMGAVFGVATVAGPLLGGFIVDTDGLGWRWCFYVCIPLAVIAFLVIQRVLKLPKVKRDTRIDVFGAFTITGSATALMLLLSLGGKEFDWNSPWTYALAGVSVLLVLLSIVAERVARDPILPPRLFRNRTFVLAAIASLCVGVAMFGAMIYLPQYLQIVKGMSPTASGLMTLPLVIGMFVTSTGSGQFVTRTGRYKIFPVLGLVFVAAAMFLLSQMHSDTSKVIIGADGAVLGVGLGLTLQILILAAQNAARIEDLAATTAGVSFFRNLGGAMGVAAFGAILSNRLTAELKDSLASAHVRPPAGGASLGSPEQVHHLPEPFKHLVLESFTKALESVFLVGIPVAVLGFIAVLALKELPLRGSGKTKKDADEPATPTPAAAAETATVPDAPVAGRHAARTNGHPVEQELVGVAAANHMEPLPTADQAVPIRVATTAPAPNGLAAPIHTQLFDQPPPEPAPGGGRIRGFVRGGDGSPVQAAALTLIDVTGHQLGRAFTGDDGSYAMPAPGSGTYVLIAAAGDHEPQAATLVVGDKPLEFDLLLAGNGGLAGRVRGKEGAPIEGAMVVVTDVRGEVVGTVRTGADGSYSLKDVVSGAYTIAVSAAGHRPAAAPVQIAGTGQTRHDVELLPGASVRGTVRNAAGEPLGDARVTLVDGAGNVVAMVITAPDGEYAFADLTGGQYTVIASGYPPVATALSLGGGGLDGHDLQLGFPEE
ncbi:MFS transporter [Actinomadura barringtoniae]|uniref:MFS transporter n=1 Tax=Actinomadura barringtoniae TaxID=1427535 RepID=UPI0027DE4753|nr:MFS transporter [Actinomadura barringtoniae]